MALAQTATASFRVELLEGVHHFGPTTPDTFKLALYTSQAALGVSTTAYTATGEITGTGYVAGGVTLTLAGSPAAGYTQTGISVVYVSFSNLLLEGVSFVARGGLIYNSTQGNKSVAVLDFGADKSTTPTNTFPIVFPAATPDTALLRL